MTEQEPKQPLTPEQKAAIYDPVSLLSNVQGYEAVFNPDAALQTIADEAVADQLSPHNSEFYQKAEFPTDPELTEAMEDSDHRREDVARIAVKSQASVAPGPDGTQILYYENEPSITVNQDGENVDEQR